MSSPRHLLETVESALLGPSPPTSRQRIELFHALRSSTTRFQSLLTYPVPKTSDRSQVQSKEVRLPDSSPITLDDQDVQIALKLSDDLNLNEINCVSLLVAANQEWGLSGRDPLEILRLATGLWYTERRDIITSLYTLLRAVVLDQGLEADLLFDIQKYLEDLFTSGLRQRMIALIKELNREEPAGLGGPQSETHMLDSRGALVERRAVVCRERLSIGHCLVLSGLVVRMSPKDVNDVFSALKDCACEVEEDIITSKLQIKFCLLFSVIIALISDALSKDGDRPSILSNDLVFRREFQGVVMTPGNDPNVEGFVNSVRLAWSVHLMLTHDGNRSREITSGGLCDDMENFCACLEFTCSSNVFQFLLDKILRTAAFQNDDEDMIYMYTGYMHKMMTCFLSHRLTRDKIKEMKEKAMSTLNQYAAGITHGPLHENDPISKKTIQSGSQPFLSLLELVSEIYQNIPELLSGNDDLWTFINFAGEDHTNTQTLVAFLLMLGALACSEEGASRIFELLQGKAFRSVGWNKLFDCLSIYEQKFRECLQNNAAILPDFPEGDAKALVAYLNVLQKVIENGNSIERKKWFPDIEPLFKLLGYENVPPYLKGALRNAITAFVHVSPALKATIWSYLEQYDLPVVVGPSLGSNMQQISTQVYDMRFELNEVEARMEKYPSTISFLNLLNVLIAEESDLSDRGRRFIGIFRFVYDHVFGPFPQRAYADPKEKWQLVVSCLEHFRMVLKMYDVIHEDVDNISESLLAHGSPLEAQLPVLELLKDFMSGGMVFRNVMSILSPGVNTIIHDRTNQLYGQLLEKAVYLSLEIIILIFEKDLIFSDFCRPMYQPLDVILSHDHNQIISLLEFVRYDFLPDIQQCSVKIMSILSSRMVELVQILLKSNVANSLIEDYAACLELRSEACQAIENIPSDLGVLIIQLLIDNINRSAPNITHLLLKFNVNSAVEQTVLQPKFHYSCLKVILDILEKLAKPEINALLHEFGLQLLYELCLDPLTCVPTMDLLSTKKYQFFLRHLNLISLSPLPKRSNNQAMRISSLHQRSWLLKLLAHELHAGDLTVFSHRETCLNIVDQIFIKDKGKLNNISGLSSTFENIAGLESINKGKALELLEIVQFRPPDVATKYSQVLSSQKYDSLVDDILSNSATSEKGGVYYYSERGDRLLDLSSFRDKLWQMHRTLNPQVGSTGSDSDLSDLREIIQQLLRWGWKYNKNLEEQAAQLHMLIGWSQIVEVFMSRRMPFLENRSQILFEILDACLNASSSSDCSLKMALILSQVSLTCIAKLRDERFLYLTSSNSDTISCLDIILNKQLSNGACLSILFKLTIAILRPETSEVLRRRQYALLLSYFQYCRVMLNPNIPLSVQRLFLHDELEGVGDLDLEKIDKEQAELEKANFSIIRKECPNLLDLLIKDAINGSEAGKTVSLYVLDAFVSIDQERFFLNQMQSRGFLRSCLLDVAGFLKDGWYQLGNVQRLYTLEAELSLLLRVCHNYDRLGAQVLFSMGALEHLTSCKVPGLKIKGSLGHLDLKGSRDTGVECDKQRLIMTPILRLVSCLTALIDTSDFLEVKNKIVREVIEFVKGHQLHFDQALRESVLEVDELALEQIRLAVSILSKVWPYEENDKCSFLQGLFGMMHVLFSCDPESFRLRHSSQPPKKMTELPLFQLCFSLTSYLHFLVIKKSLRLQDSSNFHDLNLVNGHPEPTLSLLLSLLILVTNALERAIEERSLLFSKIQDINELSRQEVDEIISMCMQQDCVSPADHIQKRRYIAMVEMCQVAGNKDQLVSLLYPLTELLLNIFLIHLQDSPTTNTSMHNSPTNSMEDISSLCGKLLPILERIELLSEDKSGHKLKMFRRLLTSLKDLVIQQLAF